MEVELLQLPTDTSLLNSNFDGYKLSLDQLPIIKKELETPINWLFPDTNNYTLLRGLLFGFHNHLIGDSVQNPENVYFIDKCRNIKKTSLDPYSNDFNNVTTVWQVPLQKNKSNKDNDYNISLKLCSDNMGVVADGSGFLYLVNTGNRNTDEHWSVVFSEEILGPDNKFIISDAVLNISQKIEMHILLTNITKCNNDSKDLTLLHWVTLAKNEDNWQQMALKQLKSEGFIQYSFFEKNCNAIYVVNNSTCTFISNSETEIVENLISDDQNRFHYTWSQNSNNIVVTFISPSNILQSDIYLTCDTSRISVKYKEMILLSGNLHLEIVPNLTTWTCKNQQLEIVFYKKCGDLVWTKFVEGDDFGKYENEEVVLIEDNPLNGITFNSQAVEDCDFESDKMNSFKRFCCLTQKLTHKINLGYHQVLLTVNLDKTLPPSIGVRNDVDICVYQPQMIGKEFSIVHNGTLLALGYIQASKQARKFFACSPDMTYSVITESNSHLFIYRQNKTVSSGELRNRISGEKVGTVAQQQVVNLSSYGSEILGIYATNTTLFLLTENFIIGLKL